MSMSTPLQSLLELGIGKQKALFALREHNGEVEAACDWCFGVSKRLSGSLERIADDASL
jgi:uncharacterized UBP type Zn finger protein